jgi:hypothetical protein
VLPITVVNKRRTNDSLLMGENKSSEMHRWKIFFFVFFFFFFPFLSLNVFIGLWRKKRDLWKWDDHLGSLQNAFIFRLLLKITVEWTTKSLLSIFVALLESVPKGRVFELERILLGGRRPPLEKAEKNQKQKGYNTQCSLVVSYRTTSQAQWGLT